ncbi:MAG: DASS family sodium-coupled anion symporter [Spirochaetales bacterium]|uniref:DASS family sodium-coupled anion symporter n=1 Tax=Candidatus Thalassospirochaeta sargassi TaxID=3119039 RepID=A0AAJ1ICM9_9SPIO|nr:DASS family sodium-coupled anion symporter [Spirochaetales bacterium]
MKELNKKSTSKTVIFFIAAVVLSALFMMINLPQAVTHAAGAVLNHDAQVAMGVMIFALILWVTEAVPFHITGMLGVFLLAVLGVDNFKEIVIAGFGNHIFVFFIGVLILSAFITQSGLGRRISVFLLSKTGNSTGMIVFGFMLVGTLLSMWITNMAVAAMLMPLGAAILKEEGAVPLESRFGKALMIAICWGSTIGGIATPSGAGPNPLAIGFLKDMVGVDVSFIDWMVYGLPAALLLLVPGWTILMLFYKPEMRYLKKTREELQKDFQDLPPFSREETVTLILFLFTVVLWLTTPIFESLLGISIPISMPVLLTSCLFFVPGLKTLQWKTIEKEVSWSGILLVVTGISIGMMLYKTGAANWLSVVFLGGIGGVHPLLQVFLVILIVSFLKIAFSSNSVTATIIIPIMIALGVNLGGDPLSITMPAALTASMAFILVTSSPTNVIPYSAGYFSIKDMAVAGVVMTFVASAIVSVTIFAIGQFTGLY